MLAAAEKCTMDAYIVVSLRVGARTEGLRALCWGEVDVDGRLDAKPPVPPSIAVYRSIRVGGDTKTTKSRRRLALPGDPLRSFADVAALGISETTTVRSRVGARRNGTGWPPEKARPSCGSDGNEVPTA